MHPIVILIAGFLVVFVGGGARFAIGLTLKPMVADLGWNRAELGLAVGIYFVASAIATFFAGRIVDRTSPRLLLNAGVIISAAGIGLMSLVSQPWHAALLYGVIFALGNGATSLVPVGVMVTRAFAGRTGLVNAVIASGVSVGQLVIIAILAAVLASIGWRAIFSLACGSATGAGPHAVGRAAGARRAADFDGAERRHERRESVANAEVMDAARDLRDLWAR
jgi:MFS family permease